MEISKIKIALIDKIIAIDDIKFLNKIQETIDGYESFSGLNEPIATYEKVKHENIRVFNEWEQKRIDRALEQYKNGECISDEEADKEIQKWLED
jgi:hypothetical protein